MASQALWRVDPEGAKGLDGTIAYDWSPPSINRNNTLLTAGLRFNEPLPLPIHNTISLGYVRNSLSADFLPAGARPWKSEQGVEFNGLLDVLPMPLLQPVVQYYANVGGGTHSAVVFGFRTNRVLGGASAFVVAVAARRSLLNIGGLVGALLPVFFVLALGYVAGKRHVFDADQAAGLSELALGFALPASLFVGMTEIPKELLLFSHDGLFPVARLLLRRVKFLQGPGSS
jgi:hypothetical protein